MRREYESLSVDPRWKYFRVSHKIFFVLSFCAGGWLVAVVSILSKRWLSIVTGEQRAPWTGTGEGLK
jgi:hypothetical protein